MLKEKTKGWRYVLLFCFYVLFTTFYIIVLSFTLFSAIYITQPFAHTKPKHNH